MSARKRTKKRTDAAKKDADHWNLHLLCASEMNVYSRKARIQQQYTFGFSSSIVKCLASDNGYGSPPDDDVYEPVKRRSPWDDVFGEQSEDSMENVSPLSGSASICNIETPKTLPKRQRG